MVRVNCLLPNVLSTYIKRLRFSFYRKRILLLLQESSLMFIHHYGAFKENRQVGTDMQDTVHFTVNGVMINCALVFSFNADK